jgi:Fe-S cluster biosynthesis and repair protein YggX
MAKEVVCAKLKQKAVGLDSPPFPGALGERIFNEISQEAWSMWVNHQTMLINEYRLSTFDPKARQFLREEMEKYFFGEGSDKPSGYQP